MSIPTARYFVANNGLPLIPSDPGRPLSIPVNPTVHKAWYLVDAPAEAAAAFPGKKCFILRTDTSSLYLSTMSISAQESEAQSDIVLLPVEATTNADENLAWVFVLDGTCSSLGDSFTGKLVSPDGRYTFGVRPPPHRQIGTKGRPVMSPDPEIENSTWTLNLALLGESGDASGEAA